MDTVRACVRWFDEEARELTVEAARRAGLETLTLLEEPLAAFYAWIAENRIAANRQAQAGGPSSRRQTARPDLARDGNGGDLRDGRSEERRVGKEGRSRGAP